MIHLIIPNSAVHFLRCKLHVELGKGGTQRRCSKTQSAVWMTNNRNGSTEMKHQKCSIQDNSLPLLLYLQLLHGSRVIKWNVHGWQAWDSDALVYFVQGSLSRMWERPTYERGREESSDGRSYRGACFLNALILSREWGREVCQPFDAAGLTPKYQVQVAKYSINVTTGQTEASWWKDWINLGSVTLWRDTKRDLVWRGLA